MTQLNQLQQLKQYSTVVADTGDFRNWRVSRRRTPPPTRR
jgi:hypothetical protein